MSYISQSQDPRRRATALAGTVVVHAVLGVAIVTGLTIAGYGPVDDYKPIIDIPVKPPEPTPTPPPDNPIERQIPTPAPLPPLPLPPQGPTREFVDPDALVDIDTTPTTTPSPTARPDPPSPTLSFTPEGAKPSNDPTRWITNEDYPAAPLRKQVEGTAGYRLVISTNGRVSSCEITRSAGNGALDEATCKLITRRARFEPATDDTGARVLGTYTGTVRWDIPD